LGLKNEVNCWKPKFRYNVGIRQSAAKLWLKAIEGSETISKEST
jgi:hypothetical protein